jgi:hypothetical protein
MNVQNYLIIESNVVTNSVVWDGNIQIWQPPEGSIQLIDENITAMIWQPVVVENKVTDWILGPEVGAGDIGFIWDGSVLTTNQPKPEIPPEPVQPTTEGTQTL